MYYVILHDNIKDLKDPIHSCVDMSHSSLLLESLLSLPLLFSFFNFEIIT